MAAPAYQSSSVASWVDATANIAVPHPSGVAVGDLMVAGIVKSNVNAVINTPSGWTLLHNKGIATNTLYVFWKIATSGDVSAGSTTFTSSTSALTGGAMFRVTGHDTVTPIKASGINDSAGSSPSFTMSLDVGSENLLLLFIGSNNDYTTSAQSFGADSVTEVFDSTTTLGSDGAISGAYGAKATGATITNPSATMSGSSVEPIGCLISVQPPVPPFSPLMMHHMQIAGGLM